ncbi:ATP synthase I subunit [Keratinibaculum paraultunense]|uniref:ATP synthase I subunit n=2 Tax=Keratinibaculum paraultunense TaxID=1278232 RepID=A0A4R3KU54_9FIRM|nr:ATP synthase I subunit [Keratinibaculum paraultunense]
MMFNDENIVDTIIKRTIILSFIIIGIIIIGIKNPEPFVLGYIFGVSVNILTFKLMEKSIEKAVTMEPSKAYGYSVKQYMIRYLIYAIVLTVGVLADYLSILTIVLGLFMIKIVILSMAVVDQLKNKFK